LVEKKLKRVRFKIDKDIDSYINEDAYNDNNRFQIQRIRDEALIFAISIILEMLKKYNKNIEYKIKKCGFKGGH
jgi:uncharacterized FlaG/YvyC family protein